MKHPPEVKPFHPFNFVMEAIYAWHTIEVKYASIDTYCDWNILLVEKNDRWQAIQYCKATIQKPNNPS